MAAHTMKELLEHRFHTIELVAYVSMKGIPVNATIECVDCGTVLVSVDDGEFLATEELTDYDDARGLQ